LRSDDQQDDDGDTADREGAEYAVDGPARHGAILVATEDRVIDRQRE
jgi:hypothetical protein